MSRGLAGGEPPQGLVGTCLLGLALLLGVSCHGAAQTSPSAGPRPEPMTVVDHAQVFLISPHDGGRSGRKVACDDSAVPIDTPLPLPSAGLEGALRALLALREQYDAGSGLLNQLYASRLEFVSMTLQGNELTVQLSGYVERGDGCDNERMLAELNETAMQFNGISYVRFEVAGQPLRGLLTASSAPQPAAAAAPATPPPAPPNSLTPASGRDRMPLPGEAEPTAPPATPPPVRDPARIR